jgi:hypothetical protein
MAIVGVKLRPDTQDLVEHLVAGVRISYELAPTIAARTLERSSNHVDPIYAQLAILAVHADA